MVISTRVRLARNLQEVSFTGRASQIQATEAVQSVERAIGRSKALRELTWISVATLTASERALLVERGLVGEHFASSHHPRGMALSDHGDLAILVNEEDHVRVQAVRPGLQVEESLEGAMAAERALGEHLPFSFHSRWGYLTACPTNVGTGLRVSVMLHLPAMVLGKQLKRLEAAAKELRLAIRGFRGEGTANEADLYQVSNHVTLGRSAQEIAHEFATVIVPELVEWERAARRAYLAGHRWRALDRASRDLSALQSAHLMPREEAMRKLGRIRHGVCLGVIGGITQAALRSLMLRVQPEHLALERPASGHGAEAELLERASLLREAFADATARLPGSA
ncbi:MAG: hypothetical protein O2819_06055 [Planctomycetota bacterium]|nr:hypothetical protein [Planctomycetota bacterium]